jgi:hypothetical protein
LSLLLHLLTSLLLHLPLGVLIKDRPVLLLKLLGLSLPLLREPLEVRELIAVRDEVGQELLVRNQLSFRDLPSSRKREHDIFWRSFLQRLLINRSIRGDDWRLLLDRLGLGSLPLYLRFRLSGWDWFAHVASAIIRIGEVFPSELVLGLLLL